MRRSLISISVVFSLALTLGSIGPTAWIAWHDAHAQGKKRGKPPAQTTDSSSNESGSKKLKVFDFTGLDVSGQLRAPQLLYFLDRANEELQRASLERRSFIPELVRSIDEESL